MILIAVLPAPKPRKVLPGASALMVAMLAAVTGGGLRTSDRNSGTQLNPFSADSG